MPAPLVTARRIPSGDQANPCVRVQVVVVGLVEAVQSRCRAGFDVEGQEPR